MIDTSTEEYLQKYRKAIAKSDWVLLPDQRQFMVMWRLYEQFGVRHIVSGEQYAMTYEEAIRLNVVPLILCPVAIDKIELP
jgi:hypothetical protein